MMLPIQEPGSVLFNDGNDRMNVQRYFNLFTRLGPATLLSAVTLSAQQPAAAPVGAKLVAVPAKITMQAGDSLPFKVIAYDAQGNAIANAPMRVGGPRRSVQFGDGFVRAFEAGTFTATAAAAGSPEAPPVTVDIPVTVTWPPAKEVPAGHGSDDTVLPGHPQRPYRHGQRSRRR